MMSDLKGRRKQENPARRRGFWKPSQLALQGGRKRQSGAATCEILLEHPDENNG